MSKRFSLKPICVKDSPSVYPPIYLSICLTVYIFLSLSFALTFTHTSLSLLYPTTSSPPSFTLSDPISITRTHSQALTLYLRRAYLPTITLTKCLHSLTSRFFINNISLFLLFFHSILLFLKEWAIPGLFFFIFFFSI